MKQISGLLGADEKQTGAALGAGLPAIIGGLMKKVGSPGGTQQIFDMAGKFDGGMLGNIGGALGGGNHSSLIQTGTGLLGSIFGGQQSGLMGTIARMSGMNQGAVSSLLGIVAPMVMSALSKAKSSSNLDAAGMAGLLMSQKDHVARALPAELKTELGLGGVLGQGVAAAGSAGASVGGASRNTAQSVKEAAPSGGGLFAKLVPLVVVAVLAWFGYQYFAGSNPTPAMRDGATTATDAIPGVMPDVDALKGKVTSAVDDVSQAVGGITDQASATAAIDKLNGAASSLGGLNPDSLSGPAKTSISGLLEPLMGTLKGALDKGYAIPGFKVSSSPSSIQSWRS